MLAFQREGRSFVVEMRAGAIRLPACGGVARFAISRSLRLLKSALVRIHVASAARSAVRAVEARRALAWRRDVALLARDGGVRSGKRERRRGVRKPRSRPPGCLIVATRTIRAKLRIVGIFVTGSALVRQAQKGSIKILHLDFGTRRLRNLLRVVTALAA